MPIKLVIAVTDAQWYHYLASTQPHNEVNFWSPSARDFRALRAGELFLFKLKYPRNFIVGGGLFSHASIMPLKIAWDAFGVKNGAPSLSTMQSFIIKYKSHNIKQKGSLSIGCRIISSPFFLIKEE